MVLFERLLRNGVRRVNERCHERARTLAPTSWLLGTTTWQFGDIRRVVTTPHSWSIRRREITARYFKMHPVMFGEYVPLGDIFPALYNLFPLPNGLTPGTEPVAVSVGGLRFSSEHLF